MLTNANKAVKAADLSKVWNLPWQEMEVLIGGRSSIDLPRLRVRDREEATAFVCNYGFNPEDPRDQRTIQAVMIEAVHFIESFLIPPDSDSLKIPEEVIACSDVRDLLVWASDANHDELRRLWSCAVLRVIHTIAHIEGTQRRIGVRTASDQVHKRFLPYLRVNQEGRLFLGDNRDFVELERIDWKIGKSRESTILKLLHKRGNVAETIFDMIGVRIVTKRFCDVMMVIKYLRKFHMITFANCIPGRTRNNLIDVESFKQSTRKLRRLLRTGRISDEQFITLLEQSIMTPEVVDEAGNPHSAQTYRSIQLTCRQLIRAKNPNLTWMDQLESIEHEEPEVKKLLEMVRAWPGVEQNREVGVFYPFEVQVLDRSSYEASLSGSASHDRYKSSQIIAARRRILSDVLTFVSGKPKDDL